MSTPSSPNMQAAMPELLNAASLDPDEDAEIVFLKEATAASPVRDSPSGVEPHAKSPPSTADAADRRAIKSVPHAAKKNHAIARATSSPNSSQDVHDDDDATCETRSLSEFDTQRFKRRCKNQYLHMKKDARWLNLLSIGGPEPLQDIFTKRPFMPVLVPSLAKTYMPTKEDFKEEIFRRTYFIVKENTKEAQIEIFKQGGFPLDAPRPKNWNNDRMITWLETHYIGTEEDNSYLLRQISKFAAEVKAVLQGKNVKHYEVNALDPWNREGFRGLRSACRLVHVFVEPDLREPFLRRRRRKFEPSKDEPEPVSFWDLASDLYNDTTYCPASKIISAHEFGKWFKSAVELVSCNTLDGLVDAEMCRRQYAYWIKCLRGVLLNWETAKKTVKTSDYTVANGNVQPHVPPRVSFLKGPPIVMYLWYMLEEADLLDSSVGRIPIPYGYGAGDGYESDERALAGNEVVVDSSDGSVSTRLSNKQVEIIREDRSKRREERQRRRRREEERPAYPVLTMDGPIMSMLANIQLSLAQLQYSQECHRLQIHLNSLHSTLSYQENRFSSLCQALRARENQWSDLLQGDGRAIKVEALILRDKQDLTAIENQIQFTKLSIAATEQKLLELVPPQLPPPPPPPPTILEAPESKRQKVAAQSPSDP